MTGPYPDNPTPPPPAAALDVDGGAPRHGMSPWWAAVLVAVILTALGLPIGWIWASVAPRVAVVKTDAGFRYADPEPEQPVAADGWFAIIGAVAGVLLAVVVWVVLRRHRGVAVLIGLAIGSLLGASLAWWVGHKIGLSQFQAARGSAAVGARIDGPLGLRMTGLDRESWWPPRPTGVAAVQALAAAFIYTSCAGFSSSADLRGPDRRADPEWL